MTSKLTRERIELIANFHRAMTLPPSHAEIEELARMMLAAMDREPVAWINGCNKSVPAALRYLAENPRPIGGESSFNTAHLYQLAREIELMAEAPLYRHAQQPVVPPVMFIDGDISSDDADKLAKVIREFNEEDESPLAKMARIIRENPHPTNECNMPKAQQPVAQDERAAFNAWNNDVDCPLAGRDAKSAVWLAWQARAKMAGNSPVIPDGYVMVPKEPTERMVIDGFESEPDETFSEPEVWEAFQKMSGCEQAAFRARLCWAAMLAAAPQEVK